MNLNLFVGGPYWRAWGTPPWYAACLSPLWYLIPGSKRRRPSLVLGGLLPASLLGLGFLAPPLLAYMGMPWLPGPFLSFDPATLAAADSQVEGEATKTAAYWSRPDVDPLAVPVQRPSPSTTATLRPGSSTGVASVLPRRRGRDTEPGRRNQAALEIGTDAFPDTAIRGLLDDWIIPAIVGELVRTTTSGRHPRDRVDRG